MLDYFHSSLNVYFPGLSTLYTPMTHMDPTLLSFPSPDMESDDCIAFQRKPMFLRVLPIIHQVVHSIEPLSAENRDFLSRVSDIEPLMIAAACISQVPGIANTTWLYHPALLLKEALLSSSPHVPPVPRALNHEGMDLVTVQKLCKVGVMFVLVKVSACLSVNHLSSCVTGWPLRPIFDEQSWAVTNARYTLVNIFPEIVKIIMDHCIVDIPEDIFLRISDLFNTLNIAQLFDVITCTASNKICVQNVIQRTDNTLELIPRCRESTAAALETLWNHRFSPVAQPQVAQGIAKVTSGFFKLISIILNYSLPIKPNLLINQENSHVYPHLKEEM